METQKSAFSVALKYAIITALASFIFGIIMYVTNLYLNQAVSWLQYVILLAGIIFCVKDRRDKDLGGYITFGQGFSVGFLFCILTGLFSLITSYIMISFIAPDMIEQILKMTEQSMIDKGMSDDQISMAMGMTKKMMTPVWMSVWVMFFTAFFGAILSLIVAAIMRKENSQLQQPQ
ncbi:MAG: DUF4199 domain-containing protein [Chitinophagales bacterium]|nr:DUF4199 domain-containing protein [Chitinophagales bacterium]